MAALRRNNSRILRFLAGLFLAFVSCCTVLKAQNSQGTILGRVTDPSGAAVAGASVKVTNRDTAVSRQAKTNSVGDYVFVDMIPGYYGLEVTGSGFKKSEASSIRVDVDATLRQDFQLALGGANETVTVTADSQLVQTDNVSSGTVVPGTLIEALQSQGATLPTCFASRRVPRRCKAAPSSIGASTA